MGSTPVVHPPGPPRYSPPRVHPPGTMLYATATGTAAARVKDAVGLRSVDQLSLYAQISEFQGITEGYNLAIAGIPNDH